MSDRTHIARWDLDKTYLRTEFDTFRDLVRTAMERPEQKRTNPGAATLLREMIRGGISVHILSGSPEQMRSRLEDKLRLDGVMWDRFTLKPNLRNVLRLRFRAVRDQLGYKLPALLRARIELGAHGASVTETLVGDDAEADAFVYSLYADIVEGRVDEGTLQRVCARGNVYPDVALSILEDARRVERAMAVERVLIHLEQQSPPDDFQVYGRRVVPFYNYMQAAFVVYEDGRLPAEGVLRVADELIGQHRFDGDALARSYRDLVRRGHARGTGMAELQEAFRRLGPSGELHGEAELRILLERLPLLAESARTSSAHGEQALPNYPELVVHHNRRRRRRP